MTTFLALRTYSYTSLLLPPNKPSTHIYLPHLCWRYFTRRSSGFPSLCLPPFLHIPYWGTTAARSQHKTAHGRTGRSYPHNSEHLDTFNGYNIDGLFCILYQFMKIRNMTVAITVATVAVRAVRKANNTLGRVAQRVYTLRGVRKTETKG